MRYLTSRVDDSPIYDCYMKLTPRRFSHFFFVSKDLYKRNNTCFILHCITSSSDKCGAEYGHLQLSRYVWVLKTVAWFQRAQNTVPSFDRRYYLICMIKIWQRFPLEKQAICMLSFRMTGFPNPASTDSNATNVFLLHLSIKNGYFEYNRDSFSVTLPDIRYETCGSLKGELKAILLEMFSVFNDTRLKAISGTDLFYW